MNVSPSSLDNKIQSVCTVLFEKKIDTESRSTITPKLSSWIVVLISTSHVNACSCNSGIIYVIVTVWVI